MAQESSQTLERNLLNPRTDIEQEIATLGPWFHNLHLPGDVQTAPDHPLGDSPRYKWQHMMSFVPQDLHGCGALDIVTSITEGTLFFQTLTIPQDGRIECPRNLTIMDRGRMLVSAWPKMAFIEHSLEGDPTNWWVPNQAAVAAMLRSCGWQSRQYIGEEIYVCWDRRLGLPLGARSDLLKGPNHEKENHHG